MLRGSATLLAGGVVGALTASGIASETASAETDLTVEGDSVEIRSEEIAAVLLDLTVAWGYEVPSGEAPETVELDVLAGTDEDELDVVASDSSEEVFLESDGEETFSVDLLGEEIVEADTLVPEEGGEETATEIVVGVEFRQRDENDMVIAADSETTTATVTIEKSEYDPDEHGDVAGSGSVTVEVE
ncbi:MAG: hypothetical protein ACLFSD_00040 [Salinivenus sp.]